MDSDKPIVQYNEGDAVSPTVGESEDDFYHLSANGFREADKYHHYAPYLLASKTRVPVLALQVTLFPNAGFSIGFAAHHAVFDGKSITMFMHSWASICRLKTRKLTAEKVHLFISNDCRARLEPPIPSTYFGNCITGCVVDGDTSKLMTEDGVAIAARAIGEAIGGMGDGVLKGAKEMIPKLLSIKKEVGLLISIASSPRFEVYKIDFGWGRPKKVEIVSIEKSGAISLSDSKDGNGGVEIGVALNKHEAEAFASLFASGLKYHQVLQES
ncbi:hypothetical protein RHGRI_011353 [Rhododendron griersonianum]|uniref:Uncharacterized protein n=1 Tax=Rhododendron griersonianum TaxID=479676 RepID=A0AAV6KLG8_9ERIC|nr:hypothetical protein RHGRI_011353 [Rhododendron griersonianum]